MTTVGTPEGARRLAGFLDEQIRALIGLEPAVRESRNIRVAKLYALYAAIIEDAISIRLVGDDSRTNQAYILERALLERLINFCFLQLCTEAEFKDYLDYTLNKVARRLDRSIEVQGEVRARIALAGGDFELPSELAGAVAKFTSERGREKTRWTNVSVPERAAVVDAKVGKTGLFMSLLTVYADASEALHGTLYGAVFHLGAYDPGLVPKDEASLQAHHCQTLSTLYLLAGGSVDDLLKFLGAIGEAYAKAPANESRQRFKSAAIAVGLTKERI